MSACAVSTQVLKRFFRLHAVHEMARKGAIEVVHVGDEHNPSDYLTKWLKKEKVERSVRYSSGAAHVP